MSLIDRAERVRQILATRSLTLHGVSQQSAQIYGGASRFYVPHNLYNKLSDFSFIPTIYQLLALSHITNYHLFDWLAAFGCDLEQIPRLRLLIRRARTTLLDSSVYDSYAWISWFASIANKLPLSALAPLQRFLPMGSPKRALELLALNKRRFLYGKVGEEDLYALPSLAAGSIVRVDQEGVAKALLSAQTNPQIPFFFVEHAGGYSCSRIVLLAKDRILLYAPQRPCGQLELHLGRDARILGVLDAEIRPLIGQGSARQIYGSIAPRRTRHRISASLQPSFSEYLQAARNSAGFSFREASLASRRIAQLMSDAYYFAAPSTLSDYETLSDPPRHVQKLFTLCVLYAIEFRECLRVSGLPLEQEGREPLPDKLVPRSVPANQVYWDTADKKDDQRSEDMLTHLLQQWKEVPLFLRHSLAELTGLKKFSLSDVFWVGEGLPPVHPLLINATLAAVNRRTKRPAPSSSKLVWAQPIYVILKRNGDYLCGHCTLDESHLAVHYCSGGSFGAQHFRNGFEAEVVGRVTAVLRRLV